MITQPATLETCPPRYGTRPNLDADHRLPHFRALARGMGIGLMPWQELVLRVASEIGDNGQPRYRQVVVIVPRQCGKSTLGALLILERMLVHPTQPQFCAFVAQGIVDGISFWANQPIKKMLAGGLVETAGLRLYESQSSPKLATANGSVCRILAPGGKATGHGQTYGMALIDEAHAFGNPALENALLPTMRTVPDPLLAITSTVGTNASTYLRDKCDRGRAIVRAARPETETAYFEWAAAADADIDATDTWRTAIPAWGYTVTERTIRREREIISENAFRQMALNQWVDGDEAQAIPRGAWLECQAQHPIVPSGEVAIAIDAPPERHRAVAAVADREGRVELVHWQNGTSWVPDWVARQITRSTRPADRPYKIAFVAYAQGGVIAQFAPQFDQMRIPTRPIDATEFCHASGSFTEGLVDGRIRVQPNRALDVAVAGAVRWKRGDKWRIGRRDQTCDVSPICAAAMAYYTAQREPYLGGPRPQIRDLDDIIAATEPD